MIPLSSVASFVELKRVPSGLEINPARGREGCLQAAEMLARFFLQELKVSPNLARVVHGVENSLLFMPASEDHQANLRDLKPALVIEDYLIFPVSPILRGWSLVHPNWVEIAIPDMSYENPETPEAVKWLVVAEYRLDTYHEAKELAFPLYETILYGIQSCLMERLQFEARSLYSLYLDIQGHSTDVDTGGHIELEYLARPAMKLLCHLLPCLNPSGNEVSSETYDSGHLVTSDMVQFEHRYTTSTWDVYYRAGKKWDAVTPRAENMPPFYDLLARRDFLSVYYQSAAAILGRRLSEIQKKIIRYKLKAE